MDREHVEPVVEIAAEFPVDNHLLEIAVGGGDQSNVGLNQLVAPQTFELLLLEDAQQFGLQFQRHIAHFIEEQGAFVRQFEAADTLGAGPGKRAAFVAEQIALQQPGGHRRAVHLHHPPTVASAEVVDSAGDKLFAGAGFAEDQHGAVALRHHLYLLEHIVHRLAAADNLPEFALDIIELLGEGEVLIHQPLFQALNFAVGEGVIDSDRHPLGDLPQQLEIGGGEDLFVALRQLKHPEQGIAGHQRQQAQGLDLIAPHLEEHFLIRRESVMFVQIKQQHLFAFEHALGEGAGFIHLALVVNRVAGVKIMRGIDVELPLAVAAQHHADGVDPEVAMDLFRHLADQLVDIQSREHRVGDRHQDAKVVALVAQQIVIDVVADPVLNLLGDHGDDLRKGMQPLELFLAPWPVVTTQKFATAEDPPVGRQRQQRVVPERAIDPAADKLRPGVGKGLMIAMQGIRPGE